MRRSLDPRDVDPSGKSALSLKDSLLAGNLPLPEGFVRTASATTWSLNARSFSAPAEAR